VAGDSATARGIAMGAGDAIGTTGTTAGDDGGGAGAEASVFAASRGGVGSATRSDSSGFVTDKTSPGCTSMTGGSACGDPWAGAATRDAGGPEGLGGECNRAGGSGGGNGGGREGGAAGTEEADAKDADLCEAGGRGGGCEVREVAAGDGAPSGDGGREVGAVVAADAAPGGRGRREVDETAAGEGAPGEDGPEVARVARGCAFAGAGRVAAGGGAVFCSEAGAPGCGCLPVVSERDTGSSRTIGFPGEVPGERETPMTGSPPPTWLPPGCGKRQMSSVPRSRGLRD
jgi:hypothetical protein